MEFFKKEELNISQNKIEEEKKEEPVKTDQDLEYGVPPDEEQKKKNKENLEEEVEKLRKQIKEIMEKGEKKD